MVKNSSNGEIYALSEFINTMAGSWDALILGDYEAIMPLPFRTKAFIHYIYPPAFTQQLGIISKQTVSIECCQAFIGAIPAKFGYIEINLNASNCLNGFQIHKRKNYALELNDPFEVLDSRISRSAKRNIAKASALGISIDENVDPGEIISIHRKRFNDKVGASNKDYKQFEKLVQLFSGKGMTFIVGARDKEGQLVAGSIYFNFRNKLYFVLNGNTASSLETGATHLLMHYTIQKFAGTGKIIDFEGSDIPSFARFYEQYGASVITYAMLRINRLPWPLSLYKR